MENKLQTSTFKGYISYPCNCNKKILVYKGSTGKFSSQCPKCRGYAVFDMDSMTSMSGKAAAGAIKRLQN